MNGIGIAFTLVAGVFLATLPRRFAAIPLLLGALYMTLGQALEVGPASFTVMRILVAVGILRVLLKGDRIANGINRVDGMLILWALWLIGSSVLHTSGAWVFRAGMIWSDLGYYFLFRIFVQDSADVRCIFKVLCVLLAPIAVLMLLEKSSGTNFFASLGGINELPEFREGQVRAQGPFSHPILAGTVGAACLPMAVYLYKNHRKHALLGLFATGGIVFASTSTGPIMMVLFILFGLALWKARKRLRMIRWLALTAVIALDAVMKAPVYYLMMRIDIAGGSTGWHRSRLIESSLEHLDEWWLVGTDYTRHWMATGLHAYEAHTDITNHLLAMGVWGGLPLMFLFIMILVAAFRAVGLALREHESAPLEHPFLIWTLGVILFGHVVNFLAISLFDQSVVFFYLVLAAIGAVQAQKPLSGKATNTISWRQRVKPFAVPKGTTVSRSNRLGVTEA
jgi:hypothetical protein